MAKQDIATPGATLPPAGIDDSMPIAQQASSFFRINGMTINNGVGARMTGKKLLQVHDNPVTAIHSDSRNAVWVQTSEDLTLYTDFFHVFL